MSTSEALLRAHLNALYTEAASHTHRACAEIETDAASGHLTRAESLLSRARALEDDIAELQADEEYVDTCMRDLWAMVADKERSSQ